MFKKILLSMLTVATLAVCQSSYAAYLSIEHVSFNGVKMFQHIYDAQQNMNVRGGQFRASGECGAYGRYDTDSLYDFDGFNAIAHNNSIVWLQIKANTVATPSGVTVGSSLSTLKNTFGEPFSQNGDKLIYRYVIDPVKYTTGNFNVYTDGQYITKIIVDDGKHRQIGQ